MLEQQQAVHLQPPLNVTRLPQLEPLDLVEQHSSRGYERCGQEQPNHEHQDALQRLLGQEEPRQRSHPQDVL